MLVGAVLAPQRAHDAELRKSRRAAEHRDQTLVFSLRDSVLSHQSGCNQGIACAGSRDGHQAATLLRMDSNSRMPSLEPSKGLQALSGCGIMPSTLPVSLM